MKKQLLRHGIPRYTTTPPPSKKKKKSAVLIARRRLQEEPDARFWSLFCLCKAYQYDAMYIHIYTYITYACISVYVYMYVYTLSLSIYIYIYVCVYIYIYMYACMQDCLYTVRLRPWLDEQVQAVEIQTCQYLQLGWLFTLPHGHPQALSLEPLLPKRVAYSWLELSRQDERSAGRGRKAKKGGRKRKQQQINKGGRGR